MGNGAAKLTFCCSGGFSRRYMTATVTSEPLNEGLGHSFCYVTAKPDEIPVAAFRSISGATVSANVSTLPSTSDLTELKWQSSAFESSASFSSAPLHPVPRSLAGERCFFSGPIPGEPAYLSGPIEPARFLSGPIDSKPRRSAFAKSLFRSISDKTADTFFHSGSSVQSTSTTESSSSEMVEWAQGRAGEDRMHVVMSEEHGWVFVGIYDGFNGPDATDFLLSHLYAAVQADLRGLLWDDDEETRFERQTRPVSPEKTPVRFCNRAQYLLSPRRHRSGGPAARWEESKRRWKTEWDLERLELERKLKEQMSKSISVSRDAVDHEEVLAALSRALRRTEEAYLLAADEASGVHPELALMGSCVLVMLMKGEDVYLMNVGDSRAVLSRKKDPDVWGSIGKPKQELERINEETLRDLEGHEVVGEEQARLLALQLTVDHSATDIEEVRRIRSEHQDDASAIANDRVKGSLKVTRAFGAGFLKKPKWNNALLEMFRIDYIGISPYISCNPFLYHHKLSPKDQFLILSSDGLYQYFTNEEAVAQVDLFIAISPEGDPAQHLVEEVLLRAADKAGMDLHELLEIPRGDRRRYHDDISVIVISFEGRIWRSFV